MTNCGRNNTTFRRGFGLIDVLLAVAASSLIYAGMAQFQNDQRLSASAISTAHQLATVSDAAKSYIKKNYVKLNTLIPANSVKEIPLVGNPNWNGIGDVQYGGGLISLGFNPLLPNGQEIHLITHHLPAIGNIPEHLESMLVTTGAPMSDRQVGVAMNAMEGNGGGMMKRPPTGIPGNVIQGSFGSWSQPIGTWASAGVPLTSGHVIYAMDTIGSPISDYLNRYNTGDPEANRLHAHIDFNGNNADNMNNLDVMTINNTRADSIKINTAFDGNTNLRITNVGNSVSFKNGLNLCNNNAVGCGISVSDDGGFYDYNDGWITLTNAFEAGGLHLSGSNNGSGNLWADGYGKFGGRVATNNLDPNDVPHTADVPGGWLGGVRAWDIAANATIATGYGNDINNVTATMNSNGFKVGDHLDAWDTTGGNVKAYINNDGYITTNVPGCKFRLGGGGCLYGDSANVAIRVPGNQGDPNSNAGFYIQDQAGGAEGVVNAANTFGLTFIPEYVATLFQSCNKLGQIARDAQGHLLSCVNGQWQRQGGFNRIIFSDNRWTWTNNTGNPVFVVFSGEYGGGKRDAPDWRVYMNGPGQGTIQLCHIYNNSTANWVSGGGSCNTMVPDGYSIWRNGNANPAMTGIGP